MGNDFSELHETKHGEYGEGLTVSYFEAKGCKHFGPWKWTGTGVKEQPEGVPHSFDHCFQKGRQFFFADTKAKAQTNYYADQGLDVNDWGLYCGIFTWGKKRFPNRFSDFRLIFVDEHPRARTIWQLSFEELARQGIARCVERGLIRRPISEPRIYFSTQLMEPLRALSDEEVSKLQELAAKTRRHNYN